MHSVPWPTSLMLFAGGVGSLPSPADHHSPPTTSSQVAEGRLCFACTPPDVLPPPLVPYERHINVLILTLLTVLPVIR